MNEWKQNSIDKDKPTNETNKRDNRFPFPSPSLVDARIRSGSQWVRETLLIKRHSK